MKKIAVITTSKELKEFQERTDIRILDINVKACDQTWGTQEYFVATIVYDDDLSSDPDYWTRLEHQYAGMAMQTMLATLYNPKYHKELMACYTEVDAEEVARLSKYYAHALVEKFRNAENTKDLEGLKMKLEALKIEKTILENKVKLLKEERKWK